MQLNQHIIKKGQSILDALKMLNELGLDGLLFVVNETDRLIGTVSDGDIRRGLLKHLSVDDAVEQVMNPDPKVLKAGQYTLVSVEALKNQGVKLIPLVDADGRLLRTVNLRLLKSYLPVDALIMAGGEGRRLRPLTETVPKPLLKVGDKPIIEYNIDRMASYGIDRITISLRYLGQQLIDAFGNGENKGVNIDYLWETDPLGTIGAASKIPDLEHETLLVMNSDLLTNIDFEQFYLEFDRSGADMGMVTIPYEHKVPYAVMQTNDSFVVSFHEKPTYTYYTNGGIYLIRKTWVDRIPKETFFNATDLMELILQEGGRVYSYPLLGYWLDIGKHEDFKKAQEDVKHLKF